MKIKFYSGDELPLYKMVEITIMTIIVKAVFLENNKYYSQVFLDECHYQVRWKYENKNENINEK